MKHITHSKGPTVTYTTVLQRGQISKPSAFVGRFVIAKQATNTLLVDLNGAIPIYL